MTKRSITDTAFTGASNYSGDTLAIITGAGERATITGYNGTTHNFSFGAIAIAPDTSSTFIIIDPVSLITQIEYDPAGRVRNTLDPKGIDSQTQYNMLGKTTETIADYLVGSPTITDSSNQTTTYWG